MPVTQKTVNKQAMNQHNSINSNNSINYDFNETNKMKLVIKLSVYENFSHECAKYFLSAFIDMENANSRLTFCYG